MPSKLTLAILSAAFMTILYPGIASVFLFLRKAIVYYSNYLIASSFPTNEEYKFILNEHEAALSVLRSDRERRVREFGLMSKYLAPGFLHLTTSKNRLLFATPESNSVFEEDEICETESSQNSLIKKLSVNNIQKHRLALIVERIDSGAYVISTDISSSLPITQKMISSGRKYFVVYRNGKTSYVDDLPTKSLLYLSTEILEYGATSNITLY